MINQLLRILIQPPATFSAISFSLAFTTYTLLLIALYPVVGGVAASFGVIPAIVAGILFGPRYGLLCGFSLLLYNAYVLSLIDPTISLSDVMNLISVIGVTVVAFVAQAAGWAANMNRRLSKEIYNHKQTQMALKEANDQLQHQAAQAAQVRSYFLTSISHKLRTPMNAAMGMNHLLLDSDLTALQREYAEEAYRGNQDTISIINAILEYTKVESGATQIDCVDFVLSDKLKRLYTQFTPQAASQEVNLRFDIDPAIPTHLCGDPTRIGVLLRNLIENSLNATQKGEILVSVQLGISEEQAQTKHLPLAFTVKDNGVGMSAETVDTLFKANGLHEFNGVDTKTGSPKGAGIGLALARSLCQLMGGELQIESKEGIGTVVTFTIVVEESKTARVSELVSEQPAKETIQLAAHRHRIQPNRIQPIVAGKHGTKSEPKKFDNTLAQRYPFAILLAEDNVLNAKVARRLLKRFGYQVDWVKDGKEAVSAVQEKSYDVVLMDIQMPELNGIEATQQIRQMQLSDAMNQPYIIAVTADTTLEDSTTRQDAGLDGYIGKPLAPDIITSELERAWFSRQEQLF
ncbi:MAG: response regulator [Chloroflexota bacterium]